MWTAKSSAEVGWIVDIIIVWPHLDHNAEWMRHISMKVRTSNSGWLSSTFI